MFCVSLIGATQVKEDFILKSDFVDTLFFGYQNTIKIVTKYDANKISLSSEKALIAYDSTSKTYSVKVSPGNKVVVLVIAYKKSDGSTLTFSYSYSVVPLSTEMINRIKK